MTPLLLAACFVLAADEPVAADLVIRQAMIHDGSGSAATVGDIAIQGERIVAVGKFTTTGSPRIIDAQGLIVAPGFIDLHNHSDTPITKAATRLNKNFLTQGCTTVVTGNCGGGRVDVGEYLSEIDKAGAGTNVAHLIPQGAVRRQVVGDENRPPSPQELQQMKSIVEQGMHDGAFGMSTGLIYTPSSYADTNELTELSRVVAAGGGIYVTHMRNEGTRLLESIEEALTIGREAGLPVHLSHFKVSGRKAWGLGPDAIHRVAQAREKGQRVTADQYPYIASSTSLSAMVIPEEYRSGDKLRKALEDLESAAKLREKVAQNLEARDGGATLHIASYKENPQWQGSDLKSLSERTGKPVLELIFEMEVNGGAKVVSFGMNEDEVRLLMQPTFVATASDGSSMNPDDSVPHPRSYGTFPRKIGHYAIDGKVVPVEQAIRSASGLPADILGLSDRGYLKPGYFADVVVFAPEQFRDTATFDKPHQYAAGVRYLVVNGQLAIDKSEVTGRLAGRALRKSAGATK